MDGKVEEQGEVIVFTGRGRGKTTAALGLACRAVGHGKTAVIIHFTGPNHPELGDVIATVGLGAKLKTVGIECQADNPQYLDDFDESVPTLEAALDRASQLVTGGECDVLVLDDINPLLHQGSVEAATVIDLVSDKPRTTTIILTGPFAPEALLKVADMVTDFAVVKPPADARIEPRKGLDY